ncbi:hypothetical protein CY34DRAFT_214800 [Suillus luteus UH-Slu-Lm8-n1]|uniref:Unplaced genomic scaffold CY34scaffold_140, whole genome shotgun sequence n=1 Tax=Suillus luteus UH-Slu-Lm8-n1 TaxID=930992 RepID=A0A0C9ZTX5_9AGAM|nr:hypothetical protein CY34DRAFT_214800 [Suillus luteus UH-Slu-Lm8-n1]
MHYPMTYCVLLSSIVPKPLICFFVPRSSHHPYTHRAFVLVAFVVDITFKCTAVNIMKSYPVFLILDHNNDILLSSFSVCCEEVLMLCT